MIGRLFFITAIFLLSWLAFRYFRTQIMLKKQRDKNNNSHKSKAGIEEVKPCALCGLHMPKDEMLSKGKQYFCSYQHSLDFDKNA